MLPPSADPGPLSDVFKAKVTALIKEQLKPIVTELAAQQKTLLSHLALLKHNHNVNDYQTTRLENIRNLEQSINFKVTGALGFCAWQHPSMGTNLREPVPADPLKMPRFIPIDQATRAERAAESAALIKEAGTSARRLDVPLTMHDFPRDPDEDEDVDTMHSSVPLFGLGAPRWRRIEGLPPHDIPGTASYDGVWAKPKGNKGLQGWDGRARLLKKPLCKLIEEGADPYGIGAPSSSSIRNAGTKLLDALDVPTRRSSLDDPPSTPTTTTGSHSPRSEDARPASSSAPAHTGLSRTSTMATIGSTTNSRPVPPPLRRRRAMADIGGPTPGNARSAVHRAAAAPTAKNDVINMRAGGDVDTHVGSTLASTTSLSRTFSTTATIGSPPPPSDVPRTAVTATTAKIAKAKAKAKAKTTSKVKAKAKTGATGGSAAQKQQRTTKRRSAATAATTSSTSDSVALTPPSPLTPTGISASASTSSVPELEQPKARPAKRGRRTAELDSTSAEDQQGPEETEGAEQPHKRRKRTAAPPTICHGVEVEGEEAGGDGHPTSSQGRIGVPMRRSTRVTRAAAATQRVPVPGPAPAQRGQATKGKKAKKAKA